MYICTSHAFYSVLPKFNEKAIGIFKACVIVFYDLVSRSLVTLHEHNRIIYNVALLDFLSFKFVILLPIYD